MYRLLASRTLCLPQFPGVSMNNRAAFSSPQVTEKMCTLCNKINNFSYDFTRTQSTHTNPNVKQKKPRKKRIKSKKSYAEILIVSDNSLSQVKTTVHKLKPEDLRMLALTNLKLSELYKLQEIYQNNKYMEGYTYDNLAVIEEVPLLNESKPEIPAIPALDLNESVINKPLQLRPFTSEILSNPLASVVSPSCDIDGISLPISTELDVASLIETEIVKVKPADTFKPEVDIEGTNELEVEAAEGTEYTAGVEEPIDVATGAVEVDETAGAEEEEAVKGGQKPQVQKQRPFNPRARQEVINRTLAAYMESCIVTKNPQRGLNAIYFHKHRVSKARSLKCPAISNISVYNALLKGFSAKGDFKKVQEIHHLASDDKLKLNVQSFVCIYECIGRTDYDTATLKRMRIYNSVAQQDGITFDRIMNEGVFLYDQREQVLKAMKVFDPKYVPKYEPPNVQYSNELVNHLNHKDQVNVLDIAQTWRGDGGNKEFLQKALNKQLAIEKEGYVTVQSIEAKVEPDEKVQKFRESLAEHMKIWEEAALEAFNRDISCLAARRSALNYEPYLRSIPTKDIITIIIDEAKKIAQGSETYSPTVNQLYRELGNKVYARYKVLQKQKSGVLDKILNIHSKYCRDFVNANYELDVLPTTTDNVNTRQKWQWTENALRPEGATISMDHQEWVPTILECIGKFLYHIVMHDLKIDVNVMRVNNKHKNYLPAFYTIFRHQGRLVKEEIKPHPVLSKLYRASVPETLTFPAYEVPMACPPIPWVSIQTGGYLISPCDVVRLPAQAVAQRHRLRDASANDLYPSFDALNQLASIPWKVNEQILDVILDVFKNGGSSRLDVPEPPSSLTPPPPITQDMDKSQRFHHFKQRLQYRRKKGEMYSLWCDCLYKLSLANHFRQNIFWLPHNMDFRGRVYPVPPHLNHLGSDLARSILVFAESRPLGPHGLDWLKLHLVNLTGLKKRDRIHDRLIFANEILHLILDSADNPLTGKMWWAESEEPWQTLACCIEVAKAHRSPNPEEYRTHFPVHQDGSCNGLQHYAALGRDSAGAFSVNLTPAEVPQDVYSAVAVLVEEKRQQDAENGLEVAKILEGFVKRKVIKQTVMTTVYGVTRFGARLQIARQLKDIDNFPKESVWSASSYLTGRTFDSLRSMFTSTKEIQDWFTECARLISSVGGQYVEWVTPLGLPIVQPYFRYKAPSQNQVYEQFHIDKFERPNVMKQKNAFPPNFIHSLDSTHMMLTSLNCERAGINFVSVHDCYWTHPSTVHIMNKICREQFVALHSEPILENLSVFLTEKYSYSDQEFMDDGSVTDLTKRKLNRMLRKLPNTGRFDINNVLNSVYFFS